MRIDLRKLFAKQEELDLLIAEKRGVSYASTMEERILALFTELGELANATRCFKYWSGKGPDSEDKIKEEYADGLHFLLSLGVALKIRRTVYVAAKGNKSLTRNFLLAYEAVSDLIGRPSKKNYARAMLRYLGLGLSLGLNRKEIVESYLKKREINIARQESGY